MVVAGFPSEGEGVGAAAGFPFQPPACLWHRLTFSVNEFSFVGILPDLRQRHSAQEPEKCKDILFSSLYG